MVESACLMLDHLGEGDISTRIRSAIGRVVSHGDARTYDMLKLPGRPDVFEKGAASTGEMAEAIISSL
jgi:3-isopropylmalate dehydrogenase